MPWGAPAVPAAPAPAPWNAPAPAPWNAPAPAWSAPAPPEAAVPAPVEPPPVEAPPALETAPVAQTMVTDMGAIGAMMAGDPSGSGESTTLMPAWQPPAATSEVAKTSPPVSRAVPGAGVQAELTIEAGPDAGRSQRAAERALRLGRSPDNDVILRDPATSGHHARLERRDNQFWIVDLGSTNGTLVNGEPIQERQLNHGDRLTIGQNAVHFALLEA